MEKLNETIDAAIKEVNNEDFFKELYSDTGLKRITIAFFFLGSVLIVILESGIIWYERNGNHNYRTVFNQLFATISWIAIGYTLLAFVPQGIRYLVGPLNDTWCGIHIFIKHFFFCCFLLASNCVIGLRYLFIFKWKQVSVFDDDLITFFLQLSILVLSFWMTLAKLTTTRKMPLNYFICTGKKPTEPREIASGLLVILSVLLHIFVFIKIFVHQRQLEKRTQNIELGRMNNSTEENNIFGQQRRLAWVNSQQNRASKFSNMPKSMADLTTQLLCLTFLLVAIIIHFMMNKTDPADLNKYQNRWIVYFNQLITFAIGASGICIQYYVRNSAMRTFLWRLTGISQQEN